MDLEAADRFARERPGDLLPPRLAGDDHAGARAVDLLEVGAAGIAMVTSDEGMLVVPLAGDGAGVRRAVAGDGAWGGVLDAIGAGRVAGRFSARRFGPVLAAGAEHDIDVDQSNDSVVIGDTAVVKLYIRTAAGPQPGLDLPAHLAAVGFDETPTPFGALVWHDDDGTDVLAASAAAYLPGARDGWAWYPELVAAALDDTAAWRPAIEAASSIGGLVARLHHALATPSAVLPAPVSRADAGGWADAGAATLREAIERTTGEEGERLRTLAPRAAEVIDTLRDIGATPVTRIHGDLHVGQILRWAEGDAVSDLDGNPLSPLERRVAFDAPARDVASMARAIDHVGRVVQRRRPGHDDGVRAFIRDARRAFLDAYRDAADPGLFDERLLAPFEVAQEAHEYVYAARYLPRWRSVPNLAMPDLLGSLG